MGLITSPKTPHSFAVSLVVKTHSFVFVVKFYYF
jgi:hypothetical protein